MNTDNDQQRLGQDDPGAEVGAGGARDRCGGVVVRRLDECRNEREPRAELHRRRQVAAERGTPAPHGLHGTFPRLKCLDFRHLTFYNFLFYFCFLRKSLLNV